MNINALVLGSHVLFARAGTVISGTGGGTVSRTFKPIVAEATTPPTPDANWPELGIVEKITPTPKFTMEMVQGPAPGAYVDIDVKTTSKSLLFAVMLKEISELELELLFGAASAITDNYVPLAGDGQVKGWFKFQQYDGGNVKRNVLDVFGSAVVKPITMDNKLVKAELEITVLYSALNSGTLSLG